MTITVKHSRLFNGTIADNPADFIRPSHWDESHTINQSAAGLVGAAAAGPSATMVPADVRALLETKTQAENDARYVRTVNGTGPDGSGNVAVGSGGGGGSVDSVNGLTGIVVLDKDDIGLSNVDNTSDANKPVSTATASELAAKVSYTDLGAVGATPGTNLVGYKPSASGAVGRNVTNVLDDMLTVKDFGAIGDNSTNDLVAFQTAYTHAVSTGLPIVIPAGTYVLGGTWTISNGGIKVVALGDVTLRHTGTGVAVAIDGGVFSGANIFDIEFGRNSPIAIKGNASTTYGLHIRGAHQIDVDVDVRDCQYPCYINFTVLSRISVRCSYFDGAYTVQPTTILYVDKRETGEIPSANEFWVIAEGSASYGVDLVSCTMSRFGGSSEGNDSGGLRVRTGAYRNSFLDMDNEANGTSADWLVEGNDNVFENCLADITATSLSVTGDRNRFVGGYYATTTVGAAAEGTVFEDCELISFTDSSTTTHVRRCHNGATFLTTKDPSAPTQMIGGISIGTIAAGETRYFSAGVLSTDFYQSCFAMPFAAEITGLRVYTQAAPGAGQTQTFTISKDNVDTAITGAISGAASNSMTASGSVSVAAGDRIAVKGVGSGTAAATGPVSFGISYRVTSY